MKTYTLFHSFKLTLVLLTLSLTIGISNAWGAHILVKASDMVSGEKYIITAVHEGTTYYLVPGSFGYDDGTVGTYSTTLTETAAWTFTKSSNAWTITTKSGNTTYYLNNKDDSKGLRSSDNSQTWTIAAYSSGSDQVLITGASSRNIALLNNTKWRSYSGTSNGHPNITLYKIQSCTDISPTLSYSTDSIGIGGTATVASLNKDGSTGSVTYSISPASGVATINASTGELTGTGTGNVTVTATIAAAEGKCEGTATATIKVRRGITYYVGATSYTIGGIDGNTLVSTLPASPSSCDDTNYPYFYGWKNGSISGISSSAPTILSSELVSSSTAANTYYAVFTNVANLTFGFESGEDETGWTNVITGTSSLGSYVTAHGGSRAASVRGSTTTIIQTANKIIPSAFSAWITKESGNTETPSEWKLQKSTDGSSWTDVASWSATSPTRGTWNKITLSASQIASITVESYIRIILSTTINAYRDMDDVSISYGTGDPEYITTCCTALGTINGSINLTQTETTMTVNDWTYNAGSTGTTESNVSSYTVKLYKLNGSSEWELANNTSNSGGTSGTAATRTGISWESKSVTWSGLEYGATYKVTVEAVGTGEYCNGAETAVTSVNGNELTNNEILWKYSIYLDNGTNTNSGWAHHWINSLSSNEGSVTVNNLSADATYKYKLTLGGIVWYSANATMTSANCTNWTLYSNVAENCGMTAGLSGNYTFIVNTGSPSVSVTYPLANQTADYPIYFDKSVITEWTTAGTSDLYLRIGKSGNNKNNSTDGVSWSLVPGTDRFYQINSLAYNGFEAWQIANNASWSGNYSIYTVNGSGYEITKGTVFIKEVVGSTGMTVIPTTSKNTEDGCNYWNVSTSEGMLTHNVAVGSAEHGTVVATYTNTSGTANQTVAEGANADLAHRCIVTITATPDEGYSCTALTVNGVAFTSGSTHILAADATVAATFTANKYDVTLKATNATTGSDQVVQATYDADMPTTIKTAGTAIVIPERTGYTFTGWFDAESDGTKYYNANGTSAHAWDKASATNLYAQWSINSYTLTWATVRGKITTAGTGAAVDATGNVSSSVEYNTALTVPECGNSNGYTFSGWSPTPASNMPAENTTYTAQWTANEYTVTLNNQGATTAGAASVSATFAQAMPSIAGNLPERTGYSFGGYFTNTNGGGTKYYKADGTSATNMALYGATPTLYAYWIAQISFSVNGNIISTQAVTAALPSSATVPTSCGDCWAFAGWSTNSECSTAPEHAGGENATTHGITTPTTLYAVYRKGSTSLYATVPSCPTYTITWVVNGETYSTGTPTTSTNECTGITTLPTAPSNSTLTCADKFMGWSESTLTGTGNDAPDDLFTNAAGAPTIDGNKTFYAVFATSYTTKVPTPNTYTHTIGSQTWSSTGSQTLTSKSWSLSNNGDYYGYDADRGQQVGSGNNPASSMTLSSSAFSGTITSVKISTSGASSISATVGVSVGSTDFTKDGDGSTKTASLTSTNTEYTFSGSATGTITISWAQTSSKAIYFKKIVVGYTTMEDGTDYKDYVTTCCAAYTITGATTSGTVVTGGTLTSTNNSSCEGNDVKITATVSTGYRFNGWNITSGGSPVARKDGSAETEGVNPIYIFTMPAGNVTVSATITLRTATVTLDANSGTGADQTVTATYGDAMPLETTSDVAIAVPTKTGAKLLGYWDTDASSGGTQYYSYDGSTLSSTTNWDKEDESVTLYARWLTVDYYIDDMHGTTGYTGAGMEKSGAGYTVPGPIADSKAGNVCETEHYIFVGWVSADGQNTDGTLKGTPTIVQPAEVKNASGTTYYAVWAEE